MATFIAIIDVLGLVSAILSLLFITFVISWNAGKEDWSIEEIAATFCSSLLWSSKVYSKKTMMVLWVGTIAVTAIFGMTLSFWFSVVVLAVVVPGNLFLGKHAKPALI